MIDYTNLKDQISALQIEGSAFQTERANLQRQLTEAWERATPQAQIASKVKSARHPDPDQYEGSGKADNNLEEFQNQLKIKLLANNNY